MAIPTGCFRRSAVQDRTRALAKTACYRLLMVMITVVVALVVTGSLAAAINIGLVTNAIKTVTYYGYERVWDHVDWGLNTPHATG